jgi:hypothetical protein
MGTKRLDIRMRMAAGIPVDTQVPRAKRI